MELRKATKKIVKLRLGLSGASGFGKTYSSLLLAFGMTDDWSKIAVIDTENESASLYSDLGQYNVLPLSVPYAPERYIEAIKICENAGMEVIIIDSISHEWDGTGGCLDIWDALGRKFQDWAKITPRHQAFINAILQSKCHVITTVRRKQDYDLNSENGKIKVTKVGTKEVTREGFEYEVMLNLEFINDKHFVKASKDRTSLFMNKPEFVITPETGKKIKEWCNTGISEDEAMAKNIQDDLDNFFREIDIVKNREESIVVYNKFRHLLGNQTFDNKMKEIGIKYPAPRTQQQTLNT